METPNTVVSFPSVYGSINCSILIKPFTLIGATTGEQGRLPRPLLDRIQLKLNMDPYSMEDIEHIVEQSCGKLGITLPEQAIKEIAQRSSFIPRKANNLLRIIRNHIISRDISRVTGRDLKTVFELLELDDLGIDRIGRRILAEIADAHKGSLGLKSLASMIGIDEKTLTKIYEPELISLGLVKFMPKGRSITERGLEYLGIITRGSRLIRGVGGEDAHEDGKKE
jgi:Holliday junction DNA helicase RuvB